MSDLRVEITLVMMDGWLKSTEMASSNLHPTTKIEIQEKAVDELLTTKTPGQLDVVQTMINDTLETLDRRVVAMKKYPSYVRQVKRKDYTGTLETMSEGFENDHKSSWNGGYNQAVSDISISKTIKGMM